jgi:beta-lactamase class A
MVRLIALVLCLGTALNAQVDTALQARLLKMAAAHRGKVGFVARNLRTHQQVSLNGEDLVPTASTIKLLVFVEAFHQIKEGKKSLNDEITLREEDQVPGSGVFQFFRTPLKFTFEDAISMMMIESDNTATNLVIDHIGRDNINARAGLLGLKNTYLYKKVYRPAEGQMPPEQKQFGLGKTTAVEMAKLMEGIVICELEETELCKRMVQIMKNQSYRNMIPHYIEADLDATEGESKIADKIGQLDASRSDVAAIWTENGPIVISAYTYQNKDRRWTAENDSEQLIARMAKAVYEAWSKPPFGPARVK